MSSRFEAERNEKKSLESWQEFGGWKTCKSLPTSGRLLVHGLSVSCGKKRHPLYAKALDSRVLIHPNSHAVLQATSTRYIHSSSYLLPSHKVNSLSPHRSTQDKNWGRLAVRLAFPKGKCGHKRWRTQIHIWTKSLLPFLLSVSFYRFPAFVFRLSKRAEGTTNLLKDCALWGQFQHGYHCRRILVSHRASGPRVHGKLNVSSSTLCHAGAFLSLVQTRVWIRNSMITVSLILGVHVSSEHSNSLLSPQGCSRLNRHSFSLPCRASHPPPLPSRSVHWLIEIPMAWNPKILCILIVRKFCNNHHRKLRLESCGKLTSRNHEHQFTDNRLGHVHRRPLYIQQRAGIFWPSTLKQQRSTSNRLSLSSHSFVPHDICSCGIWTQISWLWCMGFHRTYRGLVGRSRLLSKSFHPVSVFRTQDLSESPRPTTG